MITKKLLNYLDSEKDPINEKLNNYNTFNNKKDKKSKNEDNNLFSDNNLNSQNPTLDEIAKLDDDEKSKRLIRFAGDYCRASPNIILKEKYSVLNCGWRSVKSSFVVDYDFYSKLSGEKIMVSTIKI